MPQPAPPRRGLLLALGLLQLGCLLAAVLVALALRTTGYASAVAGLAEEQLRREGLTDVQRDRDVAQRPCRLNALVRPEDAVSAAGARGRKERLEVAVLEVREEPQEVARRLADGLQACRTARSGEFVLRYEDVRRTGDDVSWTVVAQGPVRSSGVARLTWVGPCALYLVDQRTGERAVGGQRLDRLERALRAGLRGRTRTGCTD